MSLESNEIETIKIKIKDSERKNLKDSLGGTLGRKNRVRIYSTNLETGKSSLEVDTTNIIVYRGRDWLMQRAFNQNLHDVNRAWKDMYLSWFAVGVGGANEATPLIQINPSLPNYQLANHGSIASGTRYVTVNSKDYHSFDAGYPQFLNDPDITNSDLDAGCTHTDPVDSQAYRCDKFLIGEVATTLASDECNGDGTSAGSGIYASGPLAGQPYQDINEAGLFISPSNDTGYSFAATDMQLFARITFPTQRKDERRQLVFHWLIYF
jgi:hypothetical protein